MTEQEIKEIVKSFAYGYSSEEVSEIEGITLDEAVTFQRDHAEEIEAKRKELKEGGWNE